MTLAQGWSLLLDPSACVHNMEILHPMIYGSCPDSPCKSLTFKTKECLMSSSIKLLEQEHSVNIIKASTLYTPLYLSLQL
jgi:hypothetical protein